jgi:ribosomal protein S18 acetylase RimI-like enzyme
MKINKQEFHSKGLIYTIQSATARESEALSYLRAQIDGETENMDREKGEAFMNACDFEQLIHSDAASSSNLFLIAIVKERIVGYSRCEGINLKRFHHKVEFGVGVLKDFWGYGIGKNLLIESISWADSIGIKKMTLNVLETNQKAIDLYKRYGFEVEGILKKDRYLSDGKFYSTVVMGRSHD